MHVMMLQYKLSAYLYFLDDDTLIDSASSCDSFSTLAEDDHRKRAHSFDCNPQESNDSSECPLSC